jgi:uncharacterized protein (DUF1778 family)
LCISTLSYSKLVQDTQTDIAHLRSRIGLPSGLHLTVWPSSCPAGRVRHGLSAGGSLRPSGWGAVSAFAVSALGLAAPCCQLRRFSLRLLRPGYFAQATSFGLRPDQSRQMAKKDQQLTVRVSEEEKREIERRAGAAGRSVSRYLAEAGLSDDGQMEEEKRAELMEDLGDILEELQALGTNVNQIAYRLNARKPVPPEAVERAAEAVEQASDVVIEAIEEVA